MAVTLTWGIEAVKTLQSPKTDFITEVQWYLTAVDSDTYKEKQLDGVDENDNIKYKEVDVPWSVRREGTLSKLQESESFTAFTDLTETQIIGWVKNILGTSSVASIEKNTKSVLESKKTPSQAPAKKDLPW